MSSAREEPPQSQSQLQSQTQQQSDPEPEPDKWAQFRLRSSTKLIVGGSLFAVFSTLITRRALARRRIAAAANAATSPSPSSSTATSSASAAAQHASRAGGNGSANSAGGGGGGGARDALEALHLATLNVASFAMVSAGVSMRLFDVETLDDLRRKVRGGAGADGSGRTEQEVEEDWEEWLAETLARRREKEKDGKGDGDASKKG